jgi:hypothetical protein
VTRAAGRWFWPWPRITSDLIDRHDRRSVAPAVLTDYVEAEVLRYNEHLRVGSTASSSATICDRFYSAPPSRIAKLRELESIGVDQFNIYLMTHGQEETLETYGRDILPQFSGVAA